MAKTVSCTPNKAEALFTSVAVAVAICCLVAPVAAEKPPKLKVFVTADASPDGFTTPRMQDSLRDLRGAIERKSSFVLHPTEDGADLVLRLMESGYRASDTETTAVAVPLGANGGAVAVAGSTVYATVCAMLEVGDFSKAFCGSSEWTWRYSTDRIAGELEKWTKLNREALNKKIAATH